MLLFELLPPYTSITEQLYCEQLDRQANQNPCKHRAPGRIHLLHNNVRPKLTNINGQKLLDLGWEGLIQDPYSLDVALSDYHLFLFLGDVLLHWTFSNDMTCISGWRISFPQAQAFHRDNIQSLARICQKKISCALINLIG